MPRPRKPTNVLALKGAFKENPKRLLDRANEPRPVGSIGNPPKWFNEAEIEAWNELVEDAHPGTVFNSDREFMVYAALVWSQLKACERGNTERLCKLGLRFEQIVGRLGMTPADRSRVSVVGGNQDQNPYAEFARKA